MQEEEKPNSPNGVPTSDERYFLRYFHYIHQAMDTVHVAPMEDAWMNHILALIPRKLLWHTMEINALSDEVKEDFIFNAKKAVVDLVLQDPKQPAVIFEEFEKSARDELHEAPKSWDPRCVSSYRHMSRSLYVVDPCLAQLLDLWYETYL